MILKKIDTLLNSTNIGGYYEISSYNSIFFMDIFLKRKLMAKKQKDLQNQF